MGVLLAHVFALPAGIIFGAGIDQLWLYEDCRHHRPRSCCIAASRHCLSSEQDCEGQEGNGRVHEGLFPIEVCGLQLLSLAGHRKVPHSSLPSAGSHQQQAYRHYHLHRRSTDHFGGCPQSLLRLRGKGEADTQSVSNCTHPYCLFLPANPFFSHSSRIRPLCSLGPSHCSSLLQHLLFSQKS